MVKQKKIKQKLNLSIKPEVATGKPINFCYMSHTPYEFTLDLGIVMPPNNQIEILFRSVLSPERLKEIQGVINKQVALYEKNYRKIDLITPDKAPKITKPDSSTSYIG